jgi:transcriptional regulator of acetoin/glycerol metabolism
MNNVDKNIYFAMLNCLKNGSAFNVNKVSKSAGVSRQTIYNKFEKYTFQDLEKYKTKV